MNDKETIRFLRAAIRRNTERRKEDRRTSFFSFLFHDRRFILDRRQLKNELR